MDLYLFYFNSLFDLSYVCLLKLPPSSSVYYSITKFDNLNLNIPIFFYEVQSSIFLLPLFSTSLIWTDLCLHMLRSNCSLGLEFDFHATLTSILFIQLMIDFWLFLLLTFLFIDYFMLILSSLNQLVE